MSARKVYVNCAFVHQRVTGQQRYAHEITARLPADWHRVAPGGIWAQSPALTWLWTLFALPWITRRGVLLSLTSRAPLWHPRHVLTVHDLFVLEHPEWYSASYVRTHAPLLRWQLRTARRLVAVSEPVAEQIAGTLGRRPAVAPNASSAVFEDSEAWDHDAPTRRGLGSGRYFVVVGNQEPRKNLATLAAAYARLSEAERVGMAAGRGGGLGGHLPRVRHRLAGGDPARRLRQRPGAGRPLLLVRRRPAGEPGRGVRPASGRGGRGRRRPARGLRHPGLPVDLRATTRRTCRRRTSTPGPRRCDG